MSITGHSISQWLPCPVPFWVPNTIGTWGGNSVKLNIIDEKMGFLPPIKCENIERCHRLGRQVDGQRQPRAVIVRFNSERLRDAVFRARGSLKDFNNTQERATRICLNEDLTAKCASLAFKTRELKKAGRITDCWTAGGRIIIKDNTNRIKELTGLNEYQDA